MATRSGKYGRYGVYRRPVYRELYDTHESVPGGPGLAFGALETITLSPPTATAAAGAAGALRMTQFSHVATLALTRMDGGATLRLVSLVAY